MKCLAVLLAVACLLAGCGEQSQAPKEEESARAGAVLVGLYCLYGSRSEAQFDGCIHHVNPNYVAHAQTPAARFARAEPSPAVMAQDRAAASRKRCASFTRWNIESFLREPDLIAAALGVPVSTLAKAAERLEGKS